MRRAFTLVELLVVVTIIVILLALLTPALSKAQYQATLTVCGTKQKTIATGVTFYAHDHKRTYPYRDLPTQAPQGGIGIQAHKLTHIGESGSGVNNYDLRPMLRNYMPINKMFIDPFCEPVNFEKGMDSATPQTTNMYASIFLWAGWQFTGPGGGSRMNKVGDRFSYTDAQGRTRQFNLLVGDIACVDGSTYTSHPDFKILNPAFGEDFPNPFGGPMTVSQWYRQSRSDHGPLDLNFAHADGSVQRKTQVTFSWAGPDDGMTFIPNFSFIEARGGYPAGRNQVPVN